MALSQAGLASLQRALFCSPLALRRAHRLERNGNHASCLNLSKVLQSWTGTRRC